MLKTGCQGQPRLWYDFWHFWHDLWAFRMAFFKVGRWSEWNLSHKRPKGYWYVFVAYFQIPNNHRFIDSQVAGGSNSNVSSAQKDLLKQARKNFLATGYPASGMESWAEKPRMPRGSIVFFPVAMLHLRRRPKKDGVFGWMNGKPEKGRILWWSWVAVSLQNHDKMVWDQTHNSARTHPGNTPAYPKQSFKKHLLKGSGTLCEKS